MLGDMAVGVVAQLAGGVMFTPIDVIKERLQVKQSRVPDAAPAGG